MRCLSNAVKLSHCLFSNELRHLRHVLNDLISRQNQISVEISSAKVASSAFHDVQQLRLHLQQEVRRVQLRISTLEAPVIAEEGQLQPWCDSRPAEAKKISVEFARFDLGLCLLCQCALVVNVSRVTLPRLSHTRPQC